MVHESFSNSKNKIQKNFDTSKQNQFDLESKRNEILNFFTDRGKVAVSKTLYDSDFIAKKPATNTIIVRNKPNELLSELVTFDQEVDIDIIEDLLPFIDINLSVKTVPNVSAVGFLDHPISILGDERVIVKGDGNLIYQGSRTNLNVKTILTQSELDNGDFQEDYTKNVFRATIDYDFGGDSFRIIGNLHTVKLVDKLGTFGAGCGGVGQEDTDVYNTEIDQFLSEFKNYSNINTINSTSVNMTSLKEEIRANGFPDCFGSVTTEFDDVTQTHTFSNYDEVIFRIQSATKFKLVDGEYVQDSTGNFTLSSLTETFTNLDFEFRGYWLFYSDETHFFFGLGDVIPNEFEGSNFKKIELKNLPTSPDRVWTNIILERNPDEFPTTTDVDTVRVGSRQQSYFRLVKDLGDGLSKYRLILNQTLILSSKSSNNPSEDSSLEVPVYDDTYSQSGSSYTVSENHTLKDLFFYETDNQDVEFRLQLELKNPFYWEEIRNTI